MRIFYAFCLLCLFAPTAHADKKPTANNADALHGYHAFGFAELSVAASLRQHVYKKYSKSLNFAAKMDQAIDALLADPSEKTLSAAKKAWVRARNPYLKSEVLRFIFPEIDQWEGNVNAWPLDEALIDYVELPVSEDEKVTKSNVNLIGNASFLVNGVKVDASEINEKLLTNVIHNIDGIDTNVAIGYHAIEFLLWGQDLNPTGPGQRPWTDYSLKQCTNGNCDRRREYLKVSSTLLIKELRSMLDRWERDGDLTLSLFAGEPEKIMSRILEGMVEFIQAELAGERMKLALLLNDPEEEHDCFSDTTHYSHWMNLKGIEKILFGLPNMPDNVKFAEMIPRSKEVIDAYYTARDAVKVIYDSGKQGETFDQLILADNPEGNQIIQNAINKLSLLSLVLIESRTDY